MSLTFHVIQASEFVRVDAEEQLDYGESKKALQLLVQACRKRGLDRALLDLRRLPVPKKAVFTPTELAGLVQTFREAGFTREERLAILYSHDVYRGIRTFAFISRLRGLQVQAFVEFEKAMNWLSEGHGCNAENEPGSIQVPITKRQGGRKLPIGVAAKDAGKRRLQRDGRTTR
jgi:hypothetical protein